MEQIPPPERISRGESLEARELTRYLEGVGMGEVRAMVKLENAIDCGMAEAGQLAKKKVRVKRVSAIVDTGALMTLLPQDVIDDLGLKPVERIVVQLADDRKVQMDRVGPITLTVVGRSMHMDCLVGPPGCEPLIGQLVMERLDLICDPGRRTLTVRPESPDRPTIKMNRHGKA